MIPLPRCTIADAMDDPALLGAALGDGATWQTWRAILKAAFGLGLNRDEARAFASVSNGRKAPDKRVRELWAIIGRRSGKTRVAALVATFLAAFIDYRSKLAPGETGVVLILAASRDQAQNAFGYIRAFFESSPILSKLLDGEPGAESISLKGNIEIAVHANSYRTVRGKTLVACVFDEAAFWRDETSSTPDVETYRAVIPALATTGGMLIGISSPYAERGLLFSKFKSSYGKDDPDVLVIKGTSKDFNPTLDNAIIEAAERDDPDSARSEWGGEFRGDVSTYVDRAAVEACVEAGILERPFVSTFRYSAFVDPSGGAHDSFTLAIAHRDGERPTLDAIREIRAPFSPPDAVEEFVRLLKSYRITAVRGDRYAGEWVAEAFRKLGIQYLASERNKSELYIDCLPLLNSRSAVLLDHPRIVSQLSQLERRVTRGGRDSIDHQRGAQDDLANAVAGALTHVPAFGRGGATRGAAPLIINLGHAYAKQKLRGNHQQSRQIYHSNTRDNRHG